MTKSNAATVDKTKDVVATVSTPSGKVTAAVCGAAFGSAQQASVSFAVAPTNDKSWVYTCTASQTSTTSACSPPK